VQGQRYRYANSDMADLEQQLQAADAAGARTKLITTDGAFSMDGFIAKLDQITALAAKYTRWCTSTNATAPASSATGRGSAEVTA
jgi:2-amino-3-ketobutyrate coenzyme A ligase (EC 2.3.1.29)